MKSEYKERLLTAIIQTMDSPEFSDSCIPDVDILEAVLDEMENIKSEQTRSYVVCHCVADVPIVAVAVGSLDEGLAQMNTITHSYNKDLRNAGAPVLSSFKVFEMTGLECDVDSSTT